jgi:hypothetical protein
MRRSRSASDQALAPKPRPKGSLGRLARHSVHDQIAWNRRFAEIYTEDSIGRYTVDYSKFHDTIDAVNVDL